LICASVTQLLSWIGSGIHWQIVRHICAFYIVILQVQLFIYEFIVLYAVVML